MIEHIPSHVCHGGEASSLPNRILQGDWNSGNAGDQKM